MLTTPTPPGARTKDEKSACAADACHASGPLTPLPASPSSLRSYLYAALMGLLTSSCCIIQLVLNAFSIGCAGFSVLTPFRPIFLSLSISMIVYNIVQYGRSRPLQTLITVLIVTTLSLTPELVAHKNHGGSLLPSPAWWGSSPLVSSLGLQFSVWSSRLFPSSGSKQTPDTHVQTTKTGACAADPMSASPSSILDTIPHHPAPVNDKTVRYPDIESHDLPKGSTLDIFKVRVEGMKCEACANRLKRAFQAHPGIQKCTVHFQDKHLYIWATPSSSSASQESSWTESQIRHVIASVDFKYQAKLLAQGTVESTDETI
ncbi:hypothetical protein BGZ73_007641 [Actinomortierella ambigua]|nr:hypothetical protein BGZ73_007641 [Actinomortierella ambigua]